MIYRIGTQAEVKAIERYFSHQLMEEILRDVIALDTAYGENRNYIEQGGYALLVETADDLLRIKPIIDYSFHPCEWASKIKGTKYASALYVLNDDFSVVLYLPLALAPRNILENLED